MGSEETSNVVDSDPVKSSTHKQASAAGDKEVLPKGKSWPVAVLLILGALIAATSYLGEFAFLDQHHHQILLKLIARNNHQPPKLLFLLKISEIRMEILSEKYQ